LFVAGCGAESPPSKPEPGTTTSESVSPESPGPAVDDPKRSRELRIAAASDLRFALSEIISEFERLHQDAKVTVTYGSSGSFFAQLSNEAPFDLFLSADTSYPQKLVEHGQGQTNGEFEYAIGHLVVWVPTQSPLDVEKQGTEILRNDRVKKIAIANPKTAPYGRYAVAALTTLGVYQEVEALLVYGENVAQTAQMVESGGADVGIIALSLAVSPALREKGKYWVVPGDSHPPIVQGGLVLRWAQDPGLAGEFRDVLLSDDGRAILRQFGFEPAGE
jgi:molybdate transport system substrate-binding protein